MHCGGDEMTKDEVTKALRRAYNLGQIYWQQADSEYMSQHKKADQTEAKFQELLETTSSALEAKDEPWEKFCDSNCVWTDHHPDCKLAKDAPVALEVYRGEICYQSTDDDQSFGMWCPVNYDSKHGFADGTKFYTTPPQRKPLTVEEIAKLDCYDHLKFARAIEAAHGIKGEK